MCFIISETFYILALYSQNLVPRNKSTDSHWLKYEALDYMTDVVNMEMGYAFTHDIQKDYFKDSEMGDFDRMTRGMTDVSFTKAVDNKV